MLLSEKFHCIQFIYPCLSPKDCRVVLTSLSLDKETAHQVVQVNEANNVVWANSKRLVLMTFGKLKSSLLSKMSILLRISKLNMLASC